MSIRKIKTHAPIVGLVALAALLLVPLLMTSPNDYADYMANAPASRLAIHWPSVAPQTAYADSTPLENSKSVATSMLIEFPTVRPRMTLLQTGDTAWGKIVVAAMDDGDAVLGVIYQDTLPSTTQPSAYDVSSTCYYDADTIQLSVNTDSGSIQILFNDAN